MRKIVVLVCLALATDALAAPTVAVDRAQQSVRAGMKPLAVHVGGRARPVGAGFQHQWPGVYFEAAFRGPQVVLRFDDPANEYRLHVDDQPPLTLAQPGRADIVVGGIGAGQHRLRLERVTEGAAGLFGGFFVDRDAQPLKVAPRARQIEFLGDSSMTGYGARSPDRRCTPDQVNRYSDTQNAYPALVAKRFGADYQVNAVSGRGLLANFGGGSPDTVLPRIQGRLFPWNPAPYANRAWRPQIVVIRAFADFTGRVGPGQRWASFADLARDYAAEMARLVTTVHARAPGAAFTIWWLDTAGVNDPGFAAAMAQGQRTILASAAKAGVKRLDFLVEPRGGLDASACNAHWSLADHRRMAALLAAKLDRLPEDWQGRPADVSAPAR